MDFRIRPVCVEVLHVKFLGLSDSLQTNLARFSFPKNKKDPLNHSKNEK